MENSKTHNYYFKEKDGLPVLWTQGFIAFICLNVFIFLGFDVLLPTLTLYLESHGHSRDAIGRIFSFFMIAAIFMRIIAPKLVLIVRPFTLVRLGLFISSLAVASYYFAHSAGAASAARFFHGLGFGITSTILTALAAQTIPSSKMAQGMGFLGLGTILTLALGPSFGIWLKDSLGYYAMFLTVAGVYLGGLLWTMKMPAIKLESSNANRGKPKFVLISRKALIPSILLFLTGISISSMTIYLPLYFNEKGLSYSGLFFGLATTGIVFARLFSGRIHDRYGHKFTITPALICMFFANFLVTMIGGPVSLFIT
ncbi:MAG: MFS transporter, partial [Deltaproteobacteria bacterium]|nr:MFS transporter [Deltaproteobacteria bacterium]